MSLRKPKHPDRACLEENNIHVHCPSSCSHLHAASHLKSSVWYLASSGVPAWWGGHEMESNEGLEVGINTGDMDEQRKFKNDLETSDISDSIRT